MIFLYPTEETAFPALARVPRVHESELGSEAKPQDILDKALIRKVTIKNRAGLHARPISKFVEVASNYSASLTVRCNGQVVDGKSIIQLMTLAAGYGTEIELVSDGSDSTELLESLENLIVSGFDEE